jgi:hypothetical protein
VIPHPQNPSQLGFDQRGRSGDDEDTTDIEALESSNVSGIDIISVAAGAHSRTSSYSQASMEMTMCSHPSGYAAVRSSSSMFTLRGSTAPCRTGWANIGVRLLGNRLGIIEWSAVPTVCGEPAILSVWFQSANRTGALTGGKDRSNQSLDHTQGTLSGFFLCRI